LTEDALAAALAQLGNVNGTPKLLMATGTDWHLGIVGLVAGKLAERYHRPAIGTDDHCSGLRRLSALDRGLRYRCGAERLP